MKKLVITILFCFLSPYIARAQVIPTTVEKPKPYVFFDKVEWTLDYQGLTKKIFDADSNVLLGMTDKKFFTQTELIQNSRYGIYFTISDSVVSETAYTYTAIKDIRSVNFQIIKDQLAVLAVSIVPIPNLQVGVTGIKYIFEHLDKIETDWQKDTSYGLTAEQLVNLGIEIDEIYELKVYIKLRNALGHAQPHPENKSAYGPFSPSDLPASVDLIQTQPVSFQLFQNYPNPFNPETTIDYQVPIETQVRLEIYNTAGQKIRTLVDEERSGGAYVVKWDGTDQSGARVSSGVYIYRLVAGDFTATKRMLLIK